MRGNKSASRSSRKHALQRPGKARNSKRFHRPSHRCGIDERSDHTTGHTTTEPTAGQMNQCVPTCDLFSPPHHAARRNSHIVEGRSCQSTDTATREAGQKHVPAAHVSRNSRSTLTRKSPTPCTSKTRGHLKILAGADWWPLSAAPEFSVQAACAFV